MHDATAKGEPGKVEEVWCCAITPLLGCCLALATSPPPADTSPLPEEHVHSEKAKRRSSNMCCEYSRTCNASSNCWCGKWDCNAQARATADGE